MGWLPGIHLMETLRMNQANGHHGKVAGATLCKDRRGKTTVPIILMEWMITLKSKVTTRWTLVLSLFLVGIMEPEAFRCRYKCFGS